MFVKYLAITFDDKTGSRYTNVKWVIAGAMALALSFPSYSLYPLAWVATIPLLLRLVSNPSFKKILLGHFVFFLAYFGLVLYWIPLVIVNYGDVHLLASLGILLLLVTMMAVLMLPFSILTWSLARIFNPNIALFASPALWTGSELIRGNFIFKGFPWGSIGYSQKNFTVLSQAADLGGLYLLSFLVISGGVSVVLLVNKGNKLVAFINIFLITLAIFYGSYRLMFWQIPTNQTLRATLVQPGIESKKHIDYFRQIYFEQLPKIYAQACNGGTDWVVFPEAPNPYSSGDDSQLQSFWRDKVKIEKVPILLNAIGKTLGTNQHFNSLYLFQKDGEVIHRYDKRHLVPFGEYLPRIFTFLGFSEVLTKEVGNFSPGKWEQPMAYLAGEKIGFLICYESIFPVLTRLAGKSGANLLVNATNDMWFANTAAPQQHLQMAALRAIEVRKPLLRAANSGISALIDEWGRIRKKLDFGEIGVLNLSFKTNSYNSLYTHLGYLPILVIITSVIFISILWGLWSRGKE